MDYTKIINGISLLEASRRTGIKFDVLLQLVQLKKIHSVFRDYKFFISNTTFEILKLKQKEGINVLGIFDKQ